MRLLTFFMAFCIGSFSHASVVLNGETGELYLPIVEVGEEYYEVYLQQQDEVTFEVTAINSAGRESARIVRRRGSNDEVYDPSAGILSLASVQIGVDLYEVTMTHQGNMVFTITSSTLLESGEAAAGRDRGVPESSISGVVTATVSEATGDFNEVNMPYVKVGDEYFEVDLQQLDDVTFEVKTVSAPLRFRSAPQNFNTYDPATDELFLPGVQVGADLYEVMMAHQGNLVFRVTSATPVATDAIDIVDNVDDGDSGRSREDSRR